MKKKIILIVIIFIIIAATAVFLLTGGEKQEKQVISYYVPGDYFVTNIKDSTRLLKATIVLELTTDKEDDYLTENNHIIRDIIVFTLSEQTEKELRSTDIQDELRTEIVSNIEEKMGVDYIQTVYFNEFVIQ